MPHETVPADIAEAIEELWWAAHSLGQPKDHIEILNEAIQRGRVARAALVFTILSHLNGRFEEERALSAKLDMQMTMTCAGLFNPR